MAQSYAENYRSEDQTTADKARELKDKAKDVAQDVSKEARTLVDQLVNYAKANPLEATAIAAGIAFVGGGIILGPRLLESRQERDFDRILRQAYREAERIRADTTSWNRLTDWVRSNVPVSSWR